MTIEPAEFAPGPTEEAAGAAGLLSEPGEQPPTLLEGGADLLHTENLALAARLREALLAIDPAIAPELVTGETVAEIEASYAAAQAFAERVRESVRRETASAGGVPAGAPGRSLAPPLNARDKIRAGLSWPAGSLAPAP